MINDRTLQVFKAVKQQDSDIDLPSHYALVQAPNDQQAFVKRNAELAEFGISAIWYPQGEHEVVETILRLAKSELMISDT